MTLPLWVWDWVPLAREVNWYLRETRRLRNRNMLVATIRDMHLLAYSDLEILEAVVNEVPWSMEDSVYVHRCLRVRTGLGRGTLVEAKAALVAGYNYAITNP